MTESRIQSGETSQRCVRPAASVFMVLVPGGRTCRAVDSVSCHDDDGDDADDDNDDEAIEQDQISNKSWLGL